MARDYVKYSWAWSEHAGDCWHIPFYSTTLAPDRKDPSSPLPYPSVVVHTHPRPSAVVQAGEERSDKVEKPKSAGSADVRSQGPRAQSDKILPPRGGDGKGPSPMLGEAVPLKAVLLVCGFFAL
ncbi:hypothetical protein SNOG_06097 [Parastagonospora nodorum SN15]|uniref:Uncharacterized protein n=1 Tax=Phaeosphaeria nodorum (strain SN15 / ATCC MYA-4574 / FGSC 10173) TaxID=321614 RepID=Q0UQ67_PHANO|nr:hypothetical protein SNOG_06097 [Parastagonospora nodorum SN15]EAT87161.1 hypothetical protein SNOG_06097 [Parastagonospora nodorum SN15]